MLCWELFDDCDDAEFADDGDGLSNSTASCSDSKKKEEGGTGGIVDDTLEYLNASLGTGDALEAPDDAVVVAFNVGDSILFGDVCLEMQWVTVGFDQSMKGTVQ